MLEGIKRTNNFALIITLALLFTILPAPNSYVVVPNEKSEVILNIYNSELELVSNFIVPININISKINSQTDQLEPIFVNHIFNKTFTMKIDSPGFYHIEILSPELVQLTINGKGLNQFILILFWVLVTIRAFFFLYEADFFIPRVV